MKDMQAQLRRVIDQAGKDDRALQLATSHAYRQSQTASPAVVARKRTSHSRN